MLRYAITSGESAGRGEGLVEQARGWAEAGLEWVQLREKAMDAGEMVEVARAMVEVFRAAGGGTKLLVNGRVDVAVAARAAGVHLTGRVGELTAAQVRGVFELSGEGAAIVSVSCHAVEDVERAAADGVDVILFGPVFQKRVDGVLVSGGKGVEMLGMACGAAGGVPVLALGGVTRETVRECVGAGAAGAAGIRLYAEVSGKAYSLEVKRGGKDAIEHH